MPVTIKERSWLAWLAAKKLHVAEVAMVLGRTIHLHGVSKEAFLKNEKWVRHEMCHVRQFEKFGLIRFLFMYLWESVTAGYHANRYEREARACEMP